MSNKELAIDIINQIPECKLTYVIDMLNGIKGLLIDNVEEIDPDDLDLSMIAEAKKLNDGTTISFEKLLEKDGLSYADLQD
ncbi:MAG: hypothetical protein J6N52_03565 [Clostridia bacterium]|nr:hypothetical protein [Clostridia bacterium]